MTREQLLAELSHLPVEERLAVLEALARSLRGELQPLPRPAAWRSLRGLLNSPGGTEAGNAEELRVQSLLQKHA